ncbi:flagellar export protein FliJ [Liquorilactobacillus mali]|uniref:Flagellar FliJ protein n=1 Tax=Liquorilactobacillus mali KCTC 3596 = DSM 20444 TaxID=1046596 RepID=J0UV52_9LACO|nr:flagellar export protein FliJ [Liquorilactobacillus mali]EJF02199.1 flagellar export protein FliJ [Liquorilactobacillus mali KCTC 3596 = DSM 20444]KRN11133.1 flagellar export protein FliJ [Liquorilactobacillus mali KCTC 3596 = DSM 20444]
MLKFNFTLEKLLDFRKENEDSLKQEYMGLGSELSLKEKRINELLSEKNNLMYLVEPTVGRMQIQRNYLDEIDQQVSKLRLESLKLQQGLAKLLERLVAAQQERKVLEKLEVKQKDEFEAKLAHEEQKELDEFANRKTLKGGENYE